MMTTGERIRFFRKQRKLTQVQLAEMTGIHPVSIRKYEINLMQPQLEQIQRIADALNININALVGYDSMPMKISTVGDLLGFLMICHRAQLITITGERDPDSGGLRPDTVSLVLNPVLANLISISVGQNKISREADINQLHILMKDPGILSLLISWERSLIIREHDIEKQKVDPRILGPTLEKIITDQLQRLDELELILQSINTPLTEYAPHASDLSAGEQLSGSHHDEDDPAGL